MQEKWKRLEVECGGCGTWREERESSLIHSIYERCGRWKGDVEGRVWWLGRKGTIQPRTNISRHQNADDCSAVLLPTMQSRGANAGKAEAAGAVTASVSKPPACHGRTGPPPRSGLH